MSNALFFKSYDSFLIEEPSLPQAFGWNVSYLRRKQGLTKTSLALMCGISRQYLYTIECSQSDARLSCIQRLADALSVRPTELLIIEPEAYESQISADLFFTQH